MVTVQKTKQKLERKTERVLLALTPSQAEDVRRVAISTGLSKQDIIRYAISKLMDNRKERGLS